MTNQNGEDEASARDDVSWERLSTLFETAMSLPPDARVPFLQTECANDAVMRTELLTLISGADDAPGFLRTFASDVLGPAFESATQDDARITVPRQSLTGRRIRHFEVRAPLGVGGMGAVYLGRDTMLNRDVALKFLPSEQFTDPAARRRLVREAQAASALNDPNVCAIYAIEVTDDGGLCLVMSYCAGGTLRDRLRAGPLSVAEALAIAIQLASGLASAHRLNIVHRDLKPANIGFADGSIDDPMVHPGRDFDAKGDREAPVAAIAKILDFGVAVRAGLDDLLSVGTASVAGTLPYMAPEVLRGAPADERSDVWSVGIILHEMLVGQRPFGASSESALLYAILHDAPAPLKREDGALIPPALAALAADMLAKNPEDRPANGAVVLSRLQSFANRHEPMLLNAADALQVPRASNEPSAPQVPRASSAPHAPQHARKRFRAFFAVGISVTLVGLLVAILWRGSRPDAAIVPLEVARIARPLPSIAVLPFTVRGGPELQYLREGMVDLLTPVFDATGLLHGVDPNSSIGAARSLGTEPIDSTNALALAERLSARRYVVGSVVRAGAGFTLRATLYHADGKDVARAQVNVPNPEQLPSAVESLVRQLVAAELRAPGDTVAGVAASMTTSNRALRAYLDGERELRDARPAAAVVYFRRAVQEDSLFAIAWYRLARAAHWSEVDTLNIRAARRAFELSATLPLRQQQLVRGYYALRVGSPIEAERQFRQIVSDYPTDVDAWMLLGETLFDNNQYQGRPTNDAVAAFRRVMALDMRNREVTVYLMELAARGNRRGELDTLFQMYFSPNSAGEQPGIRATYLALHARRLGLPERPVADPVSAQIALRRVGSEPDDLRASRAFASVLVSATNPPAMRLEGLLALATLEYTDGNLASAARYWQESDAIDANATLLHRSLMFVSPAIEVPADTLRETRRALEMRAIPVTSTDELSLEEHRSLRVYLAGLLSQKLHDTTGIMRARQQLESNKGANRLSAPLGASLSGHLALERTRYSEADAAFDRGVVAIPFDVRARVPALGQQADRFAHATALRLVGRAEDAKRWYASVLDGPALLGAPYRTAVLEQLQTLR